MSIHDFRSFLANSPMAYKTLIADLGEDYDAIDRLAVLRILDGLSADDRRSMERDGKIESRKLARIATKTKEDVRVALVAARLYFSYQHELQRLATRQRQPTDEETVYWITRAQHPIDVYCIINNQLCRWDESQNEYLFYDISDGIDALRESAFKYLCDRGMSFLTEYDARQLHKIDFQSQ